MCLGVCVRFVLEMGLVVGGGGGGGGGGGVGGGGGDLSTYRKLSSFLVAFFEICQDFLPCHIC